MDDKSKQMISQLFSQPVSEEVKAEAQEPIVEEIKGRHGSVGIAYLPGNEPSPEERAKVERIGRALDVVADIDKGEVPPKIDDLIEALHIFYTYDLYKAIASNSKRRWVMTAAALGSMLHKILNEPKPGGKLH